MQTLLGALGASANWLPALVGWVGLPLLYANLATDVHREYAEVIKDAASEEVALGEPELRKLLVFVERRTAMFDLDWWAVGAYAALLCGIMSLVNAKQLCPPTSVPGTNAAIVSTALERGRPAPPTRQPVLTGGSVERPPSRGPAALGGVEPDRQPSRIGPLQQSAPKALEGKSLCSASFHVSSLNVMMPLYAALFGLLIGLRLIWARLVLAREVKHYYALRFLVPNDHAAFAAKE
jgi:hypothetical protein